MDQVIPTETAGSELAQAMRGARLLNHLDAVAFDLDGVVWREYRAVPYAAEVIGQLRSAGVRVCYLSNYSNQTRGFLCRRLADMGVEADPADMFTAAFLAAVHLHSTETYKRSYVTIGDGEALVAEFNSVGMRARPLATYLESEDGLPCVVVVAYGRRFGYEDVASLLRIAGRVEDLVATGRDRWYGSSHGPVPATGWIVAAAEEILDRTATVVGKPNALALQTVGKTLRVPVGRILMVGDSARADVAAAVNAGAMSCLFRDPAFGAPDSINDGPAPDLQIADLRELLQILN